MQNFRSKFSKDLLLNIGELYWNRGKTWTSCLVKDIGLLLEEGVPCSRSKNTTIAVTNLKSVNIESSII